MDPRSFQPASTAAQALRWVDDRTRAISPGIQPATTYLRDRDNQFRSGRVYARADNPTFDQPEALLNHSPAPVDMLRLSTGIEDADDLIADIEQGLN